MNGPHAPLLSVSCGDHVIDARNEDGAVRRDELAHDLDEIRHGLVHHAAEDTGMKVACGAGDSDFEVHEATKAVGNAGRARV